MTLLGQKKKKSTMNPDAQKRRDQKATYFVNGLVMPFGHSINVILS
jgi:hypothetical protein